MFKRRTPVDAHGSAPRKSEMAHRRPQGQLRCARTSIQFGTGMATEPDVPATPTIMAAS